MLSTTFTLVLLFTFDILKVHGVLGAPCSDKVGIQLLLGGTSLLHKLSEFDAY